jgi:UDP-N-acetylmuramate dehydrogenase
MIYKDISLKNKNTFGLDYNADCLIQVKTEEETISLFSGNQTWKKPLLIIGSGSNILFTSNQKGTILSPEIDVINVEEHDHDTVIISAGAGVKWDNLVNWSVNNSYGGLENLSLIPGTVGATPVQNIGAYGVEVKDVIEKVRAVSTKDGTVTEFSNKDCCFSYRNSIFKKEIKGKYLITRVYYRLSTIPLLNLDYGSLNSEIEKLGKVTLKNVREAVINIRRSKLPDPEVLGNAGSFFKNPLPDNSIVESLIKRFPCMPVYKSESGGMKLAAGWLIDQCGWKGFRKGDAGVHEMQALVLVNYGNATGKEIYDLSESIKNSVYEKFGVILEREVEIVGVI